MLAHSVHADLFTDVTAAYAHSRDILLRLPATIGALSHLYEAAERLASHHVGIADDAAALAQRARHHALRTLATFRTPADDAPTLDALHSELHETILAEAPGAAVDVATLRAQIPSLVADKHLDRLLQRLPFTHPARLRAESFLASWTGDNLADSEDLTLAPARQQYFYPMVRLAQICADLRASLPEDVDTAGLDALEHHIGSYRQTVTGQRHNPLRPASRPLRAPTATDPDVSVPPAAAPPQPAMERVSVHKTRSSPPTSNESSESPASEQRRADAPADLPEAHTASGSQPGQPAPADAETQAYADETEQPPATSEPPRTTPPTLVPTVTRDAPALDIPRWKQPPNLPTQPADAFTIDELPGYYWHLSDDIVVVHYEGQPIGHAERYTTTRDKDRFRCYLGDDQLTKKWSDSAAASHIATVHHHLTRSAQPPATETLRIEHAPEHTRVYGTSQDDLEARSAIEVVGQATPVYGRPTGSKRGRGRKGPFLYWEFPGTEEERQASVETLTALLASRGRHIPSTLPTSDQPTTPGVQQVPAERSASPTANVLEEAPEGAEAIDGMPGFWWTTHVMSSDDPGADYSWRRETLTVGFRSTTIATGSAGDRSWAIHMGNATLTGPTPEAAARRVARHWQDLQTQPTLIGGREPLWVEHNQQSTLVHGLNASDPQAKAALTTAGFVNKSKTGTTEPKAGGLGAREYAVNILVRTLAAQGRVIEIHANTADREANPAPNRQELTAQDFEWQAQSHLRVDEGRWSVADFDPGDEICLRGDSYWRRVTAVDGLNLTTAEGTSRKVTSVYAQRRAGILTRWTDPVVETGYARPLLAPDANRTDTEITAELANLALPARSPQHETAISRRRETLTTAVDRRRAAAQRQEAERQTVAALLDMPNALEQRDGELLHDESGRLLGAVIRMKPKAFVYLSADGHTTAAADNADQVRQWAFNDLEARQEASPDGWRPSFLRDLEPSALVRIPGVSRTPGTLRYTLDADLVGEPFIFHRLERSDTGTVTLHGEREGQPTQETIHHGHIQHGILREATGSWAFTSDEVALTALRRRVRTAVDTVGGAPIMPVNHVPALEALKDRARAAVRRPLHPDTVASALADALNQADALIGSLSAADNDFRGRVSSLRSVLAAAREGLSTAAPTDTGSTPDPATVPPTTAAAAPEQTTSAAPETQKEKSSPAAVLTSGGGQDWRQMEPSAYGLDRRTTAPTLPPVSPVPGQVELPDTDDTAEAPAEPMDPEEDAGTTDDEDAAVPYHRAGCTGETKWLYLAADKDRRVRHYLSCDCHGVRLGNFRQSAPFFGPGVTSPPCAPLKPWHWPTGTATTSRATSRPWTTTPCGPPSSGGMPPRARRRSQSLCPIPSPRRPPKPRPHFSSSPPAHRPCRRFLSRPRRNWKSCVPTTGSGLSTPATAP